MKFESEVDVCRVIPEAVKAFRTAHYGWVWIADFRKYDHGEWRVETLTARGDGVQTLYYASTLERAVSFIDKIDAEEISLNQSLRG
jgi:hypothetical protein